MSFAIQAKGLEYLLNHRQTLTPHLYNVPAETDREIAQIKLSSLGVSIDTLTPAQDAYLHHVE